MCERLSILKEYSYGLETKSRSVGQSSENVAERIYLNNNRILSGHKGSISKTRTTLYYCYTRKRTQVCVHIKRDDTQHSTNNLNVAQHFVAVDNVVAHHFNAITYVGLTNKSRKYITVVIFMFTDALNP